MLLALVACGGSEDEPERVADEGGLATYEVESFGFSIGVPSEWTTVSADEAFSEETLDSIREADPELGPLLDQIGEADSPIKLIAIDPAPDDGFAANLNVVVIPEIPEGTTREDYFDASAAQLEGFGATGVEQERVELPAGEAVSFRYEHSRGGVDQPLAVLQYVLFENEIGYTLTYTSLAAAVESHREEFERSALSFRLA